MHKTSSTCGTAKHTSVTDQAPEEYNKKKIDYIFRIYLNNNHQDNLELEC